MKDKKEAAAAIEKVSKELRYNISMKEIKKGDWIEVNIKGYVEECKVRGFNERGIDVWDGVNEEYYIETEGANLKDVLNHNMVDKYRTISNEVCEILRIFGIEAAREYFVREFNTILEEKIIYRHHALLADLICLKGQLMQIARYGINKDDNYSPFAKASFEEVVDVLIKASTFGESDNMQGV